jgi:hypothetical protein
LQQHAETLDELRVRVAVVTFEPSPVARQYVADTGVRWPLLIDEKRELYRAYGMLGAKFWDVWGPKTWVAYVKELVRGRIPARSAGDPMQRGGDVLFDPNGIVRVHHIGRGPADRPTVAALLRACKRQ